MVFVFGWDLAAVPGQTSVSGDAVFKLLQMHRVTSLDNWVSVPVKPCLLGSNFHLEQAGPAMELPIPQGSP